MTGVLRNALPPLVTLLVTAALWEVAVRAFAVPGFLVPPPSAVCETLWSERGLLFSAMLTTGAGAVGGLSLSVTIGTLVGIFLSLSRTLERAFYPYAVFLQTVPIVAIAPLIVLWFGPGLRAVAVSAFVVSVFPIIVSTLAGLRGVDPRLVDLFRLYDSSRFATLSKLRLPAAAPSMATGWRVAAGLSVIGAIVGEFVAGFSEGHAGLGIVVLSAYRQLRTDLLFSAVLLAAALGLILFFIASVAGTLLLRRLRMQA